MATTRQRQSKPVKQLKELLQEKQDPFVLDLYLVERGYLTNNLRSKKSGSVSKVLRAVYSKLGIGSCNNRIVSTCVVVETKERHHHHQEAAESDRFSSASSSTVFNSCPESDAEETSTSQQKEHFFSKANTSQPFILRNAIQKEAVTDRRLRWQCIEESRQLSPVSVLEEAASLHNSRRRDFSTIKETNNSENTCVIFPKKVTEDNILSASLWKVLFQSANEKQQTLPPGVSEIQEPAQCNNNRNVYLQYLKSKTTALQQTRQLLFDCVRETVENQERKQQQQQQREYLAAEELGRIIIEKKIKCWGKQSREEESNLAGLLKSDLVDSLQDRRGLELQRRKIGFEIEDAIFDDMRTEIITDMMDFFSAING